MCACVGVSQARGVRMFFFFPLAGRHKSGGERAAANAPPLSLSLSLSLSAPLTPAIPPTMPAPTAALPSWSAALARALERNTSGPATRYLQLATVRPDGRPAVRSVVFRGLHPGMLHPASPDPALAIVTDGRTAKVAHLATHPHAEAAWYFPDTREQFRLGGRVTAVEAGCGEARLAAAREEVWAGLSPGVREWHVCPEPGSARVRDGGGDGRDGAGAGPAAEVGGGSGPHPPAGAAGSAASTQPSPPHEHFTLLLLDVDAVDHVDLVADTRRVWEREAGGAWTVREVWP